MKIVYITGTTRGLGAALARLYKKHGWEVVELSRYGFDLADPNLMRVNFRQSEEAAFINNAASILVRPRFYDHEIIGELTKNLVSPIRLIQRFLDTYPTGVVVNITSGLARKSLPHFDLYCAAKAGMEGYLRSLEARGVSCINFDPGVMDTDMQSTLRETHHPARDQFVDYEKSGLLRKPDVVAEELFVHHCNRPGVERIAAGGSKAHRG